MAKRLKDLKDSRIKRPGRARVDAKVALKRMREFSKRKEQFVASIRKSAD